MEAVICWRPFGDKPLAELLPVAAERQMQEAGKSELAKLIEHEIASSPIERDGYTWAAKSLVWYAENLGVSTKTIGIYTHAPEFDRLDVTIGGKKTPLLRIKKPGDLMTRTHCQRLLQKRFLNYLPIFNKNKAAFHRGNAEALEHNQGIIQKEIEHCAHPSFPNPVKLKKLKMELLLASKSLRRELAKAEKADADSKREFSVSSHSYGCLGGLVDAWGVQDALFVLGIILEDWSGFMLRAKLCVAAHEDNLYYRFYEYPTIRFMLCFNHVALEHALEHLQQSPEHKQPEQLDRQKRLAKASHHQLQLFEQSISSSDG